MKEYKGCDCHYLLIRTDYENAKKIEQLLNEHDEIEGNIDYESVVLDCCPECGDDEFWSHGYCGHCGYEI